MLTLSRETTQNRNEITIVVKRIAVIRHYYPDFLAKMSDDTYQLIEVKGDNKIDDTVVQAKKDAAVEMSTASGMVYKMFAGSTILKQNVFDTDNSEVTQAVLI